MTHSPNLDRIAQMTELEDADAKLREEVSLSVIESLPDGIIITGPDGKIFMVNREVEYAFGYSRKELIGQTIEFLIPERFRDSHVQNRHFYMESPRPRTLDSDLQIIGKRRDNSEFQAEVSLNPVATTGQGIFVIAIVRRKRAG